MNFRRRAERTASRPSRVNWNYVADVALRIVIWLLLGSLINLFPVLIAYLLGAGEQEAAKQSVGPPYSLNTILSAGDLLIAATVMLPPTLADLALNASKAKRTRVLVVIIGAILSIVSIVFYGFAYANNLSREAQKAPAAVNLSAASVASWSKYLFLGAVVLGAVCAGFLAADKPNSKADNPDPKTESISPAAESTSPAAESQNSLTKQESK